MAALRRLGQLRTGDRISVEEYRAFTAAAMPEDDLLIEVERQLTAGGWRWHHIGRSDLAQQHGDPGWPDIVAVRGEVLIAAELKAAGGQYGTGQPEWLEAIGGVRRVIATTWRPADWHAGAIEEALR